MAVNQVQVLVSDLESRIRTQVLAGGQGGPGNVVAWVDGDSELLVHLASLKVRLTGGWLVVALDLETTETSRSTFKTLFFLGRTGRGTGVRASTTPDPGNHPALNARWAAVIREAIWNGVLDVLEGALLVVEKQVPNKTWAVAGFTGGEGLLSVRLES